MSNQVLLTDAQVQQFLVDGFLVLKPSSLPDAFHSAIYQRVDQLLKNEYNPGNNILPRMPEIGEVYSDPVIKGALTSLLGNNYTMQPHRFCHLSEPKNKEQLWHKDSFFGHMRPLRHNQTRYVMAMYYPQQVTIKNGPTQVKIGSQYFSIDPKRYNGELANTFKNNDEKIDKKMVCESGTVVIIHYDLVHRATTNESQKNRFMFKFQFNRVEEPVAPTWNCKQIEWPAADAGLLKPVAFHVWNWMTGRQCKQLPQISESVEQLTAMLQDESEAKRFYSAYALALQGNHQALIKQFSHAEPQYQFSAAYALTACPVTPTLITSLVKSLNNSKEQIQMLSAFVLFEIGPLAIDAIPDIIAKHTAKNPMIRLYCAEALGTILSFDGKTTSPHDEKAAAALSSLLLQDKNNQVRYTAALALGRMGKRAASATQALISSLQDECRYTMGNAVFALRRIGTEEALNAVLDFLMAARFCPRTTKKDPF